MTGADQAAILALGAFFIAGFANGFRTASSDRTEAYNRWNKRVDVAVARLEELTFEQLRTLKVMLDTQLPSLTDFDFDPLSVVADPAALSEQAQKAATTHRHSVRMETDFKWLRRVGPALQVAHVFGLVGTLGLTLYYADLSQHVWIRTAGFVVVGIGVLVLALVHLFRALLLNRLGMSQERSGTTDPE